MNAIVLRDRANAAAQDAWRRLQDHYFATGEWDRQLCAEWLRAEDLVDAIDAEPPYLTPDPGDHFAWPQ